MSFAEIAETRALIADIEGAQMHPQKRRRVLLKARCRLAELEAAAVIPGASPPSAHCTNTHEANP